MLNQSAFPSASFSRRRELAAVRPLRRGARVVALGGGTGLPVLLRGLRKILFADGDPAADRGRLTAIVTVADDGGSSGRLRRAYGVLPPGDIRNCLLALADGDPRLTGLFDYRFRGNGGLGGHSLGNLILTALSDMTADLPRALEWAGALLSVRGRVLPATLDRLTLRAYYDDGTFLDGESRIATAGRRISRIRLLPEEARALPEAIRALLEADLVVLGPGSLFTSIIPVLLVGGVARAIAASGATVALVANLMTEPGETDGYSADDFVTAIHAHAPPVRIHRILLNSTPIPPHLLRRYAAGGAAPVAANPAPLRFLGCEPVPGDFLDDGDVVRHDAVKLGRAVIDLIPWSARWATRS